MPGKEAMLVLNFMQSCCKQSLFARTQHVLHMRCWARCAARTSVVINRNVSCVCAPGGGRE